MSFLKKLFGGGGDGASGASKVLDSEDYNGFTIKALDLRNGSEYQLSGLIEKEIHGEAKEYNFIRADRLSSPEQAASVTLAKGRQIVDEQGDGLFN